MIICCGEALIDMISEPDGATFVPHVGGAVLNTAVALGRLGVPTGLITGLSSDPFGLMIKTALAASRVSTAHAVHNDRNTTLAFVHLENGQATYSFYDDNTATRKITTADLKTLPDDTEAIFFGGISLCNPPVADTLVEMALAQPADKLVMIDPNIRPNFITDKTVYSSRLKSLLVRADIVKLSDDDINWLIEGNASLVEKGHAVLAMGPKLLLLTQGSSGATALIKGRKPVHVAATKVEIIDTVGAGDTFNAACLATLRAEDALAPSVLETLSYEKLTKMLTTANRTAAVTVSRTGANPPWANEL
ncbi:MAG: carbohydrate kinase [Tateyamaria sp.]|jgi:fructokinase|nr:carbohydrate kinase [Tateyamaria sp.]MBT5303360.1 carbohydrate kinase [Tateyamaria sp.]MBT6267535.1 carbohydrate kinase [Tateyamaria sp.]MBT6342157.1 carbohydrate kinase [Tateyamaria sp.]MBT7448421.1 carbohydrate kinase [Tateyamaria sp.]